MFFFLDMVLTLIHGVKDQKDVCRLFCIEQLMKILKKLLGFLLEGIVIYNNFLQKKIFVDNVAICYMLYVYSMFA